MNTYKFDKKYDFRAPNDEAAWAHLAKRFPKDIGDKTKLVLVSSTKHEEIKSEIKEDLFKTDKHPVIIFPITPPGNQDELWRKRTDLSEAEKTTIAELELSESLLAGSGSHKYPDAGTTDWLDKGKPDFQK